MKTNSAMWRPSATATALLLCLLASGCAVLGPRSLPKGDVSREWRAAWVLNVQDLAKDPASARALVEEARSMNLNTLFVAAYHQGFAHYPSMTAPVYVPPGSYRPLDFDPIQEMIEAARESKGHPIRIFAWVNTCNVWRQRGLIPANHPLVQFPDWFSAHHDLGRAPDTVPEYWFDPGVPAVQQHLANVVRELASRYTLDGILLDSLEYREGGFGYNAIALQRFAAETGRTDRPAPNDPQWQEWRARQLTLMLERLALAARLQRPALPVAVVGSTEGPLAPRFEDSIPYADQGQHWPRWIESELVDILVLRAFRRQANQAQAQEFQDWLTYARIQTPHKALIAGLSARDNTLLATRTQIMAAREAGTQGAALWRFAENNTEGRPRKALFELLQSTVYHAKAKTPELRWLTRMRTGTIVGQVRNESLQPLGNVRVQFPAIGRETLSHPDGLYVLFGVPAGVSTEPRAFVESVLYPAERPVLLQPGETATADIVLIAPREY